MAGSLDVTFGKLRDAVEPTTVAETKESSGGTGSPGGASALS
jgi:hypothetical protein